MILDSITLENFGVYKGRSEFILTPEKDRPVILIGGMNGGGKTTLLDAIQLAFYGSKARVSNRGNLGYKSYLRKCINKGSDIGEGASVKLRLRRIVDGEFQSIELQRFWCMKVKGLEEEFRVIADNMFDEVLTNYWPQIVDKYLPKGLAHLFFFDGEQIKELAEGNNAFAVLGTALHSLLGVDLVDRVSDDLKILENQKSSEELDPDTISELNLLKEESRRLDINLKKEQDHESKLTLKIEQLNQILHEKQEYFQSEGGELFLKKEDLILSVKSLNLQKKNLEKELAWAHSAQKKSCRSDISAISQPWELEEKIVQELTKRDKFLFKALRENKVSEKTISLINDILSSYPHHKNASTGDNHGSQQYKSNISKTATKEGDPNQCFIEDIQKKIANINKEIIKTESDLELVPDEDKISFIQQTLKDTRQIIENTRSEREILQERISIISNQRKLVQGKIKALIMRNYDQCLKHDTRKRILKHSTLVRKTLDIFRNRVINKNLAKIEHLMLESFSRLLHKTELVSHLKISPENYNVQLKDSFGADLPADSLSAGEKQLLATSLLWGLARSSGRAMPLIIDTPLGRLDSSHRQNMSERYFPAASHQVILLSTDEEIVGSYHICLKPYITRSYILDYNNEKGATKIKEGYFYDL